MAGELQSVRLRCGPCRACPDRNGGDGSGFDVLRITAVWWTVYRYVLTSKPWRAQCDGLQEKRKKEAEV